MGSGASSPNHNSSTTIVTSNAVPAECITTVFSDDFETDQGWTANPAGTDTATSGAFERANPQATTSGGAMQLGLVPSGRFDLVTGAAAGATASADDVDGGVTTIRSPAIALPATGTTTLTFTSYFAHLGNSSPADQFQVRIVGTTTATVYAESGSATQVDAAFATHSVDVSAFAGQTVYILIGAADFAGGSLVEAAVDDVAITNQ